jgi:hypothetical protein
MSMLIFFLRILDCLIFFLDCVVRFEYRPILFTSEKPTAGSYTKIRDSPLTYGVGY